MFVCLLSPPQLTGRSAPNMAGRSGMGTENTSQDPFPWQPICCHGNQKKMFVLYQSCGSSQELVHPKVHGVVLHSSVHLLSCDGSYEPIIRSCRGNCSFVPLYVCTFVQAWTSIFLKKNVLLSLPTDAFIFFIFLVYRAR